MLLNPVTDGAKTAAGDPTGTIKFQSGIMGGVLISADGTNAVTVTLQADNSDGKTVFSIVTKQPMFPTAPIGLGSKVGYYSVSGTGGEVQFFEWVE